MLYQNRKEKTEIGLEKAKEILLKKGINCEEIWSGSLSYTNDVYIFRENGKEYVLKFFTDQWVDKNSGIMEFNVLKKLKQEGIPVPEVISFQKANESCPRNFMIMEKIKGVPLYKGFDNISMDTVVQGIELLKKLRSIEGNFGFYEHDENIHKTYESHFDFINDSVFYAIKKMSDFNYNVDEIKELFENKRKYDSQENKFSFTHCDFTPKHIFVDGEKIVGLIDFEWTIFSEPINDAVLFLTSLSEYNVQIEYLEEIYKYCNYIASKEKIAYYCARIYIMKAAWPHKNVEQPYYSQTCLDKARDILKKDNLELNDVIWPRSLGQIGE